jgi:dUTPase
MHSFAQEGERRRRWLPRESGAWARAVALLLFLPLGSTHAKESIVLRDVTGQTGIDFTHTDGSGGNRYLVEAVSAGLALFDYDDDGWIDIYFVNGAPLRGTEDDSQPRNALYRNDGGWRFTDVTEESGLGDPGFGLGVAVGDYDNDGDPDVYVNNYGPNVLYRNDGDGTFTDVTSQAGVAAGDKVGAGAAFLDADLDGDLDLYVSNYIQFTYETHVPRTMLGIPMYVGPQDYAPEPDALYRNDGDGTFTDVSERSGIAAHAGTGMGMICADYDDDGDTDIFVCNDVKRNFLFQNDGTGKFEEVGVLTGGAYDLAGVPTGSMGVDCGDYDNDGRLDFFVTDYQGEFPILYRNLGNGLLADVTLQSGAGEGAFPHVNWGTGLVDFDNDGDLDIYIANGHVQDNIELRDDTTAYMARNLLLMNTGDGRFVNVSDRSGDGMKSKLASRGTGFDDLDNDGDIDVVVLNSRREPTILRNDTENENHWVEIELRGVRTNRDGVGAHVHVVAGDLVRVAEVHSGRGYQSHHGTRLHFGLGRRSRVDRIEVRWPGGGRDRFEGLESDRLYSITQGGDVQEVDFERQENPD